MSWKDTLRKGDAWLMQEMYGTSTPQDLPGWGESDEDWEDPDEDVFTLKLFPIKNMPQLEDKPEDYYDFDRFGQSMLEKLKTAHKEALKAQPEQKTFEGTRDDAMDFAEDEWIRYDRKVANGLQLTSFELSDSSNWVYSPKDILSRHDESTPDELLLNEWHPAFM